MKKDLPTPEGEKEAPLPDRLLEQCRSHLQEGELPGIIHRVYGAYYDLLPLPGMEPSLRGRLRGKLRLEKGNEEFKRLRHLIFAGDLVRYRLQSGEKRGKGKKRSHEEEVIIEGLIPRKNGLYRSSPFEVHGLGANLDRAVLVMSLSNPPPRFGFLDRFLASCHQGDVTPMILFTKSDLLAQSSPEERRMIEYMIETYDELGYEVHRVNLIQKNESDELKAITRKLQRGVTLLAGQSGTGKSTFLNRLLGHAVQKIGEISESTGKGRHTTTNSTLFLHRKGEALLVDTPGVKEWGINHLTRQEVIESFPELQEVTNQCHFRNCDHSEGVKGCAVQHVLRLSETFYEEENEREEEVEGDEEESSRQEESPMEEGEPELEGNEPMSPERVRSLYSMIDSLEHPDRIRTGDYIKPTGRLRKDRI